MDVEKAKKVYEYRAKILLYHCIYLRSRRTTGVTVCMYNLPYSPRWRQTDPFVVACGSVGRALWSWVEGQGAASVWTSETARAARAPRHCRMTAIHSVLCIRSVVVLKLKQWQEYIIDNIRHFYLSTKNQTRLKYSMLCCVIQRHRPVARLKHKVQ